MKESSEVEAIQHGIAKINVATMLNQAFVKALVGAMETTRKTSTRASG